MKLDPEKMLKFRQDVLESVMLEVVEENRAGLDSDVETKLLDHLALILLWMNVEGQVVEFEEWRSGILFDFS